MRSHSSRRLASIFIGVALVVAAVVWIYRIQRQRDRIVLQRRLVDQLTLVIDMYMNESRGLDLKFGSGTTSQWRELDADARRWLTTELAREGDIAGDWKESILTDAWGIPVRIEVRRPRDRLEFRVSSSGSDKHFGTADDLVSTAEMAATQHSPT